MTFNPSAGGGGLSGLTSGFLLKATSGTTAGNSLVSESGSVVNVGGALSVGTGTLSTAGTIRLASGDSIQTRNNTNSTNINLIGYDDANNRVRIGHGFSGGSCQVWLDHDLLWGTDGTYTIGSSSGNRPLRMFLSDYVVCGSNASTSGRYNAPNTGTVVVARNAANSADVTLVGVDGSNRLVLRGYAAWPSSDGTSGQVLSTDGSGVLSWINRAGTVGTGWSAPTGVATRTAFATGTVTTKDLAERVKALIDNLLTNGIISA